MKNITKILSLFLALTLLLSFPVAASATELTNVPTIDESRTGSLTIYKYDLTNAEKDGVWDSSYVSTGVYDEAGVNNVLGGNASSTLGNGETGYGYAIKGVEFTYAKVADIFQYGETETTDGHVEILYAVDKAKGSDLLNTLGLADGKNRYEKADALDETKYFYQSDVLISALSSGLTANATTVKNAMERYAATNGTAMPLTDSYGKSKVENLPLGLYLVAETKVPEMVVSTTDPFLVSVPMTSVNGTNATDGGTRWIYDITLYPKNLTGIPSLEKTLRENKNDTGKTDAYAHTGTASAGDTIDYQIISTLPSITSEATSTKRFLTWQKRDTLFSHSYFRLAVSARGMSASELLSSRLMFPTPLASDSATNRDARNLDVFLSEGGIFRKRNRSGAIWSLSLSAAVYYLTPNASPDAALNPDWVEWLMGFPLGWTDVSYGQKSRRESPA